METFKINNRATLTTERSESSYGVPVLVIDGIAYGRSDDFSAALRSTMQKDDGLDFLHEMHTGEALLKQAGYQQGEPAAALVRAFFGETFHSAVLGWVRPDQIAG